MTPVNVASGIQSLQRKIQYANASSVEDLVFRYQKSGKWEQNRKYSKRLHAMHSDRMKSGGMNVESKDQEHNKDTNILVGMEK